jgi:hypothetical protein
MQFRKYLMIKINIRVYIPQNTNGLFFISLLSKIYQWNMTRLKRILNNC